MKRSPLKRSTPLRRRSSIRYAARRRRRPASGCCWALLRVPARSPCTKRVSVIVDQHERYCAQHGDWVAQAEARTFVVLRDGACVRCLAPDNLEWAHVHTRSNAPALRFVADNALALCHRCHAFFTDEPSAWIRWLDGARPGLWTRLIHQQVAAERFRTKTDLGAVIREYRVRIADAA